MSKWEWKKLGEVAEIVGGSTPKTGVEEYWNGKNIWITPAEIGRDLFLNDSVRHISDAAVKSANLKLMPAGTVILSSRAPIGKLAISNVPFYCNQGFKNAICGDLLNNKFLFFYLLSSTAELESLGKGTTFKEISKTIVENFPVPPLSEQNRIVKFLDEEFSKIETLKTNAEINLKNAKELFETTLEKELNPGKNGALPSGWEWKTLDEFSTNLDAKRKPVTKKDRVNGDYPYYGASGIVDYVDSYIYDGKYLLISEDGANLVARSTPIAFIAEGKFWVNNHAHIIETKNVETLQYLVYFFDNLDLSPYVKGMAQPKLSQDSLYKIQIPLPPLSVQKEIVARLDKLSENVKCLEANYRQIIANCDELKKSILKKTFEGES